MADDARKTAFDPAAPSGERYDANAELAKSHRALASELIPNADLQRFINHVQAEMEQGEMMKARGSGAQVIQFPGRARPEPGKGMRSVYLDNLQIFAQGDYYERPSPLGFDALRQMVEGTPVLNSVILTRIRQISRFCAPSEDGGPGFEIRHVDRKHKLKPDEEESTKLLARFHQHCGWEFKPRRRRVLKRDSFGQFMAKSLRDTLTMDSAPIETEMKRDRALGIDGYYAVDGATIRLCTEEGYEGDDSIYALQVIDGRITTAYTRDQLIYEPRNPRTDVRLAGYGLGETELLVRVVTGWLNALTMNIKGFDENSIPRGMLTLVGDYGEDELVAFKRYWNQMVRGVNNAWALPVMVAKDKDSKAEFNKFGVDFDEMMFSKWMTFLTSIICAIYGMDPTEINFESFAASKSSLSGSDTAEKLASSKDKGLRPLMGYYEGLFTDFIVSDFSDNYCFRWVGLDEKDAAQEWEGKKLVLTVDELRAEQGYGAHPDPKLGTAPLNPSLIGPWQQLNAPQPPPQGGDFGPGGGEQQDFGQVPEDGGAGGGGQQDGPPGPDASGDQPPPAADGQGGDFGGGGQGDFGKALAGATIFAIEP